MATINGTSAKNTLVGTDANDVINGLGAGDILNGKLGADKLDGGSEFDFASYTDALFGLLASLASPASNTGEAAGDTYIAIEGLIGSAFSDALIGNSADNTLRGGAGNDILDGAAGNDTIHGDDGDDILKGGSGVDSLHGGLGGDRLEGGDGDDVLSDGGGGNVMDGGSGHDELFWTAMVPTPDFVIDLIDGGDGIDTLKAGLHHQSAVGVLTIGLDAVSADGTVLAELSNIEVLHFGSGASTRIFATGGAGNDQIVTGNGNDRLTGGEGADALSAGRGSDVVSSGGGDDSVAMHIGGNDRVTLGDGDDALTLYSADQSNFRGSSTYDGGSGFDRLTLDFQYDLGTFTYSAGVLRQDGQAVSEITNFEALTIIGPYSQGGRLKYYGSAIEETIQAGYGDDVISTGRGDDTISDTGGSNTIRAGAGDDAITFDIDTFFIGTSTVDGGTGFDTLTLDVGYGGLHMAGDLVTGATLTRDGVVFAEVRGIERIVVEETPQADVLIGSVGDDRFRLGRGSDRLDAGGGDDHVDLSAQGGIDRIDGGDGIDRINIGVGGENLVIDASKAVVRVIADGITHAALTNFEHFGFSGGSGASIIGGDGDDSFSSGGSGSVMSGGAGDDSFHRSYRYGDRLNTFDGGEGHDTLTFDEGDLLADVIARSTASGYELRVGGVQVVLASSIESVSITGGYNTDDVIVGLDGDDVISGGTGGIDKLSGGGGDDWLTGGDIVDGGSGSDTMSFLGSYFAVGVTLEAGATVNATFDGDVGATLTGIENLFGSWHDDTLTGDANANTIEGFMGKDVLDGGAGIDTVAFTEARGSVSLTLAGADFARAAISVRNETDTVRNFENIVGGGYDDRLGGDAGTNRIEGGGGADVLSGGGGADFFVYAHSGLLGQDVILDFAQGADRIDLSAFDADPNQAGDQALAFLGGRAFNGRAAQVRFAGENGDTIIEVDFDADRQTDLSIAINRALILTSVDFIL